MTDIINTNTTNTGNTNTLSKKRVRRLPPDKRQKVSTACDSCKKRKFKCSGENPCQLCTKKGLPCSYTIIDKRSLKSERMAQLKQQQRDQHHHHANPLDFSRTEDDQYSQSLVSPNSVVSSQISPPFRGPGSITPSLQDPQQQQQQQQPQQPQQYQMAYNVPAYPPPVGGQSYPPHSYQPQQQQQHVPPAPPPAPHHHQQQQQQYGQQPPPFPYPNQYPPPHQQAPYQSGPPPPPPPMGMSHGYDYRNQQQQPGLPPPRAGSLQPMNPHYAQPGMPHPPPPQQQHASASSIGHQLPPPPPSGFSPQLYTSVSSMHATPSSTLLPPGETKQHGILTPETTPNDSLTSPNHYIPKSLQPLLSFPIVANPVETDTQENDDEEEEESSSGSGDDNATIKKEKDSKSGVSNQMGRSVILLNDKSGTFRYMGETSPLSLLYEARNIFVQYVGTTKLTEDLRGCPVIDKPLPIKSHISVQLPSVEQRDIYVDEFSRNINDTFYIFDMKKFRIEIVDAVYQDPMNEKNKIMMILLYFVLAIGATYSDFAQGKPAAITGAAYFESGLNLLRDVVEDSEMWVVIAHYLQFHYYQAILKKSTAWIHLNLAIKYAQSLGLHRSFVNEQFSKMSEETEYRKRLFRSLYTSDRISLTFIGRPLTINDYDWDDPCRIVNPNPSMELFPTSRMDFDYNARCQIELSKICTMIGKIVSNFYRDRIIDLNRTKKLIIDLRLWSKNLDPQLSLDNILKPDDIPNNTHGENTQILLMTHLLQLYSIMLLSRPFFMYNAVTLINSDLAKSKIQDEKLTQEFCHAATKSSILAVKLMNHYMNTAFKQTKRMECYIIITCCFYSSIVIGVTILSGGFEQEGYTENDLVDLLRNTEYILNHYSKCNKGAERYAEITHDMINALVNRHNKPKLEDSREDSIMPKSDSDEDIDYRLLNDFNFLDDPNDNLQSLIEFQQFFVAQDIASTLSGGSGSGDGTSMPYDYGNYELFFGDKY